MSTNDSVGDLAELEKRALLELDHATDADEADDLPVALTHYRQSHALYGQLAAAEPANLTWTLGLAFGHMCLGRVLVQLTRPAEGRQHFEGAAAIYRGFLSGDPESADLEALLASAMEGIAETLAEQEAPDAALSQYQSALVVRRRLAAEHPDRDEDVDLAECLGSIGDLHQELDDLPAALERFQESLSLWQKRVRQEPSDDDLQVGLAYALASVGDVLRGQEDLDGALEHFEKNLEIWQALISRTPDDDSWQALAMSLESVAGTLHEMDRGEEALARYQAARPIWRKQMVAHPENNEIKSSLAFLLENIADVIREEGDLLEALQHHQEALALRRKLVALEPDEAQWQDDLAMTLENIGDVMDEQGDLSGAIKSYEEALTTRQRLSTMEYPPEDIRLLVSFAEMRLDQLRSRRSAGRVTRPGDPPKPLH